MSPVEIKHNDEALGVIDAGTIDVYPREDASDARFWAGLRALRRAKSVCAVPVHVGASITRSASRVAASTSTD